MMALMPIPRLLCTLCDREATRRTVRQRNGATRDNDGERERERERERREERERERREERERERGGERREEETKRGLILIKLY